MNEVIGCVHSGQRGLERSQIEAIALHNFGGGSNTRLQKFRVSGQTPNRPTSLFQTIEKTSSDVASGSSQ